MRVRPLHFFAFILATATLHVYILLHHSHAVTELPDWSPNTLRNIAYYIDLHVENLPLRFCQYNTTLLILVHSRPSSRSARQAIRATWGNSTLLTIHNTSLFFLLGQSRNSSLAEDVAAENAHHGDIIVESFVDSYSNLTLKSVSMLKLFSHEPNHCRFLLKVDEDIFVNVESLGKWLASKSSTTSVLLGRVIKGERRQNDVRERWYAPKYMFLGHTYPDFLAGPAYLMSRGVAQKLYRVVFTVPIFHLEDVFLTGICARKANISLTSSKYFTDYSIPHKKCLLIELYTVHSFTPKKLLEVHTLYQRLKLTCYKLRKNNRFLPKRLN